MLYPSEYYKDKVAFVTGCTGLVGQLVIEKLLRCNVQKVYVLVRGKKGITAHERLEQIFDLPIFERLREDDDENNNGSNTRIFTKKVEIVEGDFSETGLSLKENDRNRVVEDTQLVIHSAAFIRFDESLKDCIAVNTLGTKEMLLLAEKMSKLEAFVYVSTAFSNLHVKTVEEKFYAPFIKPEIMINAINQFETDELLNIFANKIITGWPNSYTFSKALAEDLVREASNKLPVCVVRPSIILTTYKEPIPGYSTNLYGVNGVVCGVALGVLRITNIGSDTLSDIIPADYVTNLILLSAWKTAIDTKANKSPVFVYNCCSSSNSVTGGFMGSYSVKVGKTMPLKRSLWKICYQADNYHGFFPILDFFYHTVPAFLFDTFLIAQQKKPKVVKLYRKLATFSDVLGKFFNIEYHFENKNMLTLIDNLPEKEQHQFACDTRRINWYDFWPIYLQGLRKYMMKEDMSNVNEALWRHHKITLLHNIILGVLYMQFFYLLVRFFF